MGFSSRVIPHLIFGTASHDPAAVRCGPVGFAGRSRISASPSERFFLHSGKKALYLGLGHHGGWTCLTLTGAHLAFGSQMGEKRLDILMRREAADGSFRRSSGYNEVSIDNRFAPCDRRSGGTGGPLELGPLILDSDLGGTSVYFPYSQL